MDKEKLKKIKVLYYPYNLVKKVITTLGGLYLDISGVLRINKNKKRIKKENKKVKTVVFLVQYVPSWGKTKSIYESMMDDDRFNPILLCVPMEPKHGNFNDSPCETNPTYDWFVQNGYKEAINSLVSRDRFIPITDFNADYVICTRPYNALLPKCYTSKELSKHALVCFVGYGVNLSTMGNVGINKDFFRFVNKYYIDTIETKELVKNRFSLQLSRKTLELESIGIFVLEEMIKEKPTNYSKVGFNCLWTPRWATDEIVGGSNFFNYKDVLIEFFSQNNKLSLTIRPHPLMFTNFLSTGEMDEEELEEFKTIINDNEQLFLDESNEYITTLWNSSLLITDFSSMIIEFFITGKPIIYCMSNLKVEFMETMNEMLECCYVVNNKEELLKVLKMLIDGNDPLKNKRQELANKLIDLYATNVTNNLLDSICK